MHEHMSHKPEHEEAGIDHEVPQLKHLEEAGEDHHQTMIKELRKRFWVSLIFTIPILILSETIQGLLSFSIPSFTGQSVVIFVFGTIVVVYGGSFFFKAAIESLKERLADMNVLVSIAVLSGYVYSTVVLFFPTGVEFFWEISTLVVVLLFGHLMEMRAVSGAAGALRELVELIPPQANLIIGKEVKVVGTEKLNVGDLVLVRPGEKIPIDGQVIKGETSVNEALITGESKPVSKKPGNDVIGGSINGEGSITVKVTKTGSETALAQIISLVQEAQASKPRSQKLADRAAHYLTIIAVIGAILTFTVWQLIGATILFAITLSITVLVIACPHALGLAIPTVTSISTSLAAKNGLLARNAEGLERAKDADVIIYDKTGTLTEGEFGVTDIITTSDWDAEESLEKVAAVEISSEHPIAKGLVAEAKKRRLSVEQAKDFKAIVGKGAKAKIDNFEVFVGGKSMMTKLKLDAKPYSKKVEELGRQGKTVIYLATENELKAIFALEDIIREESFEAVKGLKETGKEVWMITGDSEEIAAYVAQQLGATSYFAEVLPAQKASAVKKLQAQGKTVAMVGDGINDAPALVQADIGIAIGAGTDVAIQSADIVLVKDDPRDILKLVTLSEATSRKMKQNLFWATGYNVIAIPGAAGVFIPLGIIIRPELGAIFMTASSIIVVLNALLLKRLKFGESSEKKDD